MTILAAFATAILSGAQDRREILVGEDQCRESRWVGNPAAGQKKSRVYKICGHGRKRIYREIKIDYTEYIGSMGSPDIGMDGLRKRNARRTRGTEEA